MDAGNYTRPHKFILLGFIVDPEMKICLFVSVLTIYFACQFGNIMIMILIYLDPRLHNPMYFFLSNLSFLDMSYTSVTLPKLLLNIVNGKQISFIGCLIQCHYAITLQSNEYLLLTAMAYDRYVAICNPLHYLLTMRKNVCAALAIFSWASVYLFTGPSTVLISGLSFCNSDEINHFYCDIMPLLALSCSSISSIEIIIFTAAVSLLIPCFLLTLTSYIFIVNSILRIRSKKGRSKAFSTCSSHLTVVTLLYGILFCLYLRPPSLKLLNDGKVISLFNVALIPTLNPLIYSLRNNDVKHAFWKIWYNRDMVG